MSEFDFYKGFNSMGNEMSVLNLMSSNVQNFTTPGFKAQDTSFEEIMTEGQGLGAFRQGNSTTFTQGKIKKSNNALDLAIHEGNVGNPCGTFFVISDGKRVRYTRAGSFEMKEGKLVDKFSNLRVQGYAIDENGNKKSDTLQSIDLPQDPITKKYGGMYSEVRFGDDGKLVGELKVSDPLTKQQITKTVPLFQVALASFSDPRALAQAGPTSYEATDASGKPNLGVVGDDGIVAQVDNQSLEMSNVDVPTMYQNMILAKMVYDVQLSAFKAMNSMTQSAANLVK